MEHPERPLRQRNHDKWKRIIEPAGDSESSEWSSAHSKQHKGTLPIPVSIMLFPYAKLLLAKISHLHTARYEVLDGPPATNFNHLLHHDYAEREVNNERGNGDTSWYPLYNPLLGMGRKKKWPDHSNNPSTSTANAAPEDVTIQDNDNANNLNATDHSDEDRWRAISRSIMSSPARKRPLLELDLSPAVPPSETSENAVPGEYVQKKVQSRSKQQRFNEGYRTTSGEHASTSSAPEDYSATRPVDDAEIQVLAMAGPSNNTRIVYPNGSRHVAVADDPPVVDEPPTNSQAATGAPDEVEVIMVDDAQPSRSGINTSAELQQQPTVQQKQQQQEHQLKHPKVEDKENMESSKVVLRDNNLESLNQGLIGLLECPVCMEYMGPPIHQCRRGHLVCSSCKPKLPSCPTCRSRFTESRNLAMEKVSIDEHEANCVFRSFRCTMVPPCEWRGRQNDILGHVKQVHPSSLLLGPDHVLEMRLGDFTEQSSQNWFVSALGELFRVNLGAVRGGRVQVFGCVLYLGPASHAPLFQYTLMVGPTEGDVARRKMTYSRATHCYVERCSIYYSAGDSFHLRTESAQLFSVGAANDRIMRVRLRIEKAE
ncbi:hypothetical protein C0J52_25399 [Blattella germanica]|nr:hypothetical protein C0J52_25399 [Blattella germanica]